jgi:acetyl esterase
MSTQTKSSLGGPSSLAAPATHTPADYLTDDHLTPGVRDFLKIVNAPGGKPVESLPIAAARQVLVDAQKAFKVDYSGIEETEKTIHADGHSLSLNLVRPEGVKSTLPAFIFIHGGGWVLGDYPTHRRLVRDLVVASGYACVFVNFTRSPEARYPQAIEEIYAATKWVAARGQEIDIDGGNLAVAGNSAGGNMTGAVGLMAKERGGPRIRTLVMMWPATDGTFTQASYELYGEERFLTTSLMKWSWDNYADATKRKEKHACLLSNSVEDLKGLPPTLIQVAENDILRDEGEAFGRKLELAGVQVSTVRYDGMIHDWGLLNGLAQEPGSKSVVLHAAAQLRHFLG